MEIELENNTDTNQTDAIVPFVPEFYETDQQQQGFFFKKPADVDDLLKRTQLVKSEGVKTSMKSKNVRDNRKNETLSIRKKKTFEEHNRNRRRQFEPERFECESELESTKYEFDLQFVNFSYEQLVNFANENLGTIVYTVDPNAPKIQFIPYYMNILSDQNEPQVHFAALHCIRRISSMENHASPIGIIFESGLLNILPYFIAHYTDSEWQIEMTWLLVNLSVSDISDNIAMIINTDIISMIMQILVSSENQQIIDNCVWIIANISATNGTVRDVIINKNGLDALVFVATKVFSPDFECQVEGLHSNIVWAFSSMCIVRPRLDTETWKQILPFFSYIIDNHEKFDYKIILDACTGIESISRGDQIAIQTLIESEMLPKLMVVWVKYFNVVTISYRILQTVGNVYTGNFSQRRYMTNLRGLSFLNAMLITADPELIQRTGCIPESELIQKTCRIVADLCYTKSYMEDVLAVFQEKDEETQVPLLGRIVSVIKTCKFDLMYEALMVINNLVINRNVRICEVVSCFKDLPNVVVNCLGIDNFDVKCIALDILSCLFEACFKSTDERCFPRLLELTKLCEIEKKLEMLYQCSDHDLSEKAEDLLDLYFGKNDYEEGDDDDDNHTTAYFMFMDHSNQLPPRPISPPGPTHDAPYNFFF